MSRITTRCQHLYFCTSKVSKVSTSIAAGLIVVVALGHAVLDAEHLYLRFRLHTSAYVYIRLHDPNHLRQYL
jgi:hypothetical protein